jgi:hypothetical protein
VSGESGEVRRYTYGLLKTPTRYRTPRTFFIDYIRPHRGGEGVLAAIYITKVRATFCGSNLLKCPRGGRWAPNLAPFAHLCVAPSNLCYSARQVAGRALHIIKRSSLEHFTKSRQKGLRSTGGPALLNSGYSGASPGEGSNLLNRVASTPYV